MGLIKENQGHYCGQNHYLWVKFAKIPKCGGPAV